MTKTVVVGLDGAGFELLDPWLESGHLPNLQTLVEEGISGDLESVLPPVTSPNWKAYSTGKNPGKIGIFWWQNVDTKNRRVHLPAERFHHNTEYWEVIGRDEPVGVMGMPTTYPPKAVDGFVISGAPDGQNTGFTHPPELESELKARFDYRVTKRYKRADGPDLVHEEVLELIDQRFTVAKALLAEYDLSLLHVTTFYINLLHHHLWNDEAYTLRGWKIIDDHLGDLLEQGHNLVLMSDHGHTKIESVFRVNVWLEREGYLTYDRELSNLLHRVGVNADRLHRLLRRVDEAVPVSGFRETVENLAPQRVLNHLPDSGGTIGGSKHSNTDWDRTQAIASAQGPVYLTLDPADPSYEPLRTTLIEKLSQLTDPQGRPVAAAVHRGEEVYEGPYLDEAPDIVIDKMPYVNIREEIGHESPFAESDRSWNGVNTRSGLFVAHGPAFATGTVEGMSILDLAPTILHLHGYSPPADMDGEVKRAIFALRTDH